MMTLSALGLLPPVLLGYLAVDAVWPGTNLRQEFLKLFLGLGIGLGVTSLLLFVWLWLTNQTNGFEWLVMLLLLAGIGLKIYRRRGRPLKIRIPTFSARPNWLGIVLLAAFAATLWLSLSTFVTYSFTHQHGDRDAQAIWNLHARVIYRNPADWKEVFSPAFDSRFHPDYPLLTPLDVVWGWDVLNTETTRVPIVLAGFFTFGMVGLLFTALINLKTCGQASLASLILMGTSYFILLGTFQTADVPVAYFVLSTIVLFAVHAAVEKVELLILAGLTAGLSAWTKNEGILFIGASILGCGIYGLVRGRIAKTIGPFLTGVLGPTVIILAYKVLLAPSNDLFIGFNTGVLISKITSLERYLTILGTLWKSMLGFGNWQFSLLPVLAVFTVIAGIELERPRMKVAGIGLAILTIQLLGYLAVYVITPLPLEFHLQYSLDRLLFQLFPSALFLFFWAVSAPENLWAASRRLSDPPTGKTYAPHN